MLFYIAQVISVLTILTTVLGLLSKEKEKIMFWFFLSNITLLITYFLLGRMLGSVLVAGAAIRTIIYYYYSKKNIKPSLLVLILFQVYFVVISVIMWKDFIDIFMLINLCMLTFTTWQNNMKILRGSYILSSMLLICYNILVGAYINIFLELIFILSSAYSIYKHIYLKKPKINFEK